MQYQDPASTLVVPIIRLRDNLRQSPPFPLETLLMQPQQLQHLSHSDPRTTMRRMAIPEDCSDRHRKRQLQVIAYSVRTIPVHSNLVDCSAKLPRRHNLHQVYLAFRQIRTILQALAQGSSVAPLSRTASLRMDCSVAPLNKTISLRVGYSGNL